MVCIYCGQPTRVTNSRSRQKGLQIWRRRVCLGCKSVFTTLESVQPERALTVKGSTDYQPFLRDKLLLSIFDCLKHRKTAVADATALTDTIWVQLLPNFTDGSIDTGAITEVVGPILEKFDNAAAVHYRAFHTN